MRYPDGAMSEAGGPELTFGYEVADRDPMEAQKGCNFVDRIGWFDRRQRGKLLVNICSHSNKMLP
jgi:hypothetical protein